MPSPPVENQVLQGSRMTFPKNVRRKIKEKPRHRPIPPGRHFIFNRFKHGWLLIRMTVYAARK
ncbi:MAG TPA: hypothetical protein PKM75_10080, partial [Prolixibacteraceae bacterium]|nr:hypothetical protein [Prolixibacteraceae bacterium]